MLHTFRISLFFLVALWLSLTALFSSAVHAESIVIVSDKWCPYTCQPDSGREGYLIDVARAIFDKHGIKVEYRTMPWAKAVGETQSGGANALAGALKGDAPDLIFPTNEAALNKFGFFSYGTMWRYSGPGSLKGQTFGTAQGYSYGTVIDDLIAKGRIKTTNAHGTTPLRKNIYKLRQGRLQLVIAEISVFKHTAKQFGLSNGIKYVGTPDPGEKAYVAFSPRLKSSKRYAALFSDGMAKLRASGKLTAILARYGLKDWR